MDQGAETKPWEDFAASSSKPWEDFKKKPDNYSLLSSIRSGAADIPQGYAKTLDVVGGKGTISKTLDAAGNTIGPDQGTVSPSSVVMDSKRSLLDRAKAIPYAVAEGLPGLGTDLAAGAVAGALGGPFAEITAPLGFGASFAARNFGHNVQRAVASRGGNDSVQPTSEDYLRATASTGLGAVLSRVGAKGALEAPVEALGSTVGDLLPAIGTQVAKSAVRDAATSAASNVVDQGLLDRKLDPSEALGAAALGGVQGAALRATKAPGEINNGLKFKDINPQFGDRVADRFEGLDTSDPKTSFQAIQKVQDGLKSELATRQSEAAPALKAHVEQSGFTSDIPEALRKVKDALSSGEHLDDSALQPIRDALGGTREGARLIETLEDQNTLNQIKKVGNFDPKRESFGGGLTSKPFVQDVLNPMGRIGRYGDIGLALQGALGVHLPGLSMMHIIDPTTASALAGAHLGLYAGARGVDSLLGNRNPLNEFTKRFGSDDSTGNPSGSPAPSGGYPSDNLPSFRQQAVDAKAEAAAQKEVQKAQATSDKARAALDRQRSQAFVQQQNKQADATNALWNQRSRAFVQSQRALEKAQAASEKARDSAAKALDSQRSRAFVEEQKASARKPSMADQESAVLPGMTNGEVSSTKRAVQAIMKRETMKQRALDQKLANIKQTVGLMQRSEQGPASDATTAIRVAKLRQELSGEESPLKKPKKSNGKTQESSSEGGGPGKGPRQANPKGQSEESTPAKVVVKVGDQTVERPRDGIRDVRAYVTKTRANMEARHEAIEAARKVVPKDHHKDLTQLLTRLNSSEGQKHDNAYYHIEDFVNSLPAKHQGRVMDILTNPKVLATFRKED